MASETEDDWPNGVLLLIFHMFLSIFEEKKAEFSYETEKEMVFNWIQGARKRDGFIVRLL